ncbi:MAG TPA: M50 family metallopeptidase [Candidatus Saccharimonadales bacterium]|nr:M50 family metallopeptidase [Candidatus Saccharimonadales bacterium]
MSILLLILGLVLFVCLVLVHEFGHFIMARRGNVEVEEFGIGFPPRAWGKNLKSGLLLSINWLPLGGFVKLKGENDADKSPSSFGAAPLRTKVKIMLAGVVMNLLAAFALLTLLAFVGMPRLIENQFTVARDTHVTKQEVLIAYVEADSPAQKAGLAIQDQLIRIGQDQNVTTANDLPALTQKQAGQTVDVVYKRDGKIRYATVTLRSKQEVEASKKTDSPKGYLGISPTEYVVQRSTWSAPIVAVGFMKQVTVLTFKGIGNALAGLFQGNTAKAGAQVAGPVGIFVLLKDGSLLGYQFILMIIAVISLTLAIMNALPIPALDGGRLFVTLLFRAAHRPLKKKTEDIIHGTGFAALMLLFVVITVVDVRRFL